MEGFRFLCDENIGIPIYDALKVREFDITHILALGLGGIDDPTVLQHARAESRILLTRNYKDFAPLVEKWIKNQTSFSGVLFVATSIPQADVGAHIRTLSNWVEKTAQGKHYIENTYGWLR